MFGATTLLAVCAVACAGVGGACAARAALRARGTQTRRRRAARSGGAAEAPAAFASDGALAKVLAYACELERRRVGAATGAESPPVRAGGRFDELIRSAGLSGRLGVGACRAARMRLACAGAAAGAAFGALLSTELAVLLGGAGAVAGLCSVGRAVRAERDERTRALERDLPEMLEVVALGLRSGLSFDRGFALYHEHFSTAFARECASAQRRWSLGLSPREDALRDLAASYDAPLLTRVVESAVRSLRFGTSLAEALESHAAEARAVRKARREEQIAKAPVKMMLPTGTLILPAMLVLVLGPVLLELAEGA